MTTEIEEQQPIGGNPVLWLERAIDRGVTPEVLEKLTTLVERWQANLDKRVFASAVTGFQSECPTVFKGRSAKFGDKAAYSFASYDDIHRIIRPLLSKFGIAITFSMDPAEKGMKVVCRVRVGAHCEETTLTMPIPEMKVNDTQKFGAAVSYLKRYALCAALNVVVTDEDDDAARQFDVVDSTDVETLNILIEEKGVDLARFLKYAGVERLDLIPKSDMPKLTDMLRRKKAVTK